MADLQAFKWTGLNPQGKRVDGVVQAIDAKEAQGELKKMGVEVIALAPKTGFTFRLPRRRSKIKVKDISLFTRYLSTMLASGLTIIQALDIIGHDQENPAMASLITSLKGDI